MIEIKQQEIIALGRWFKVKRTAPAKNLIVVKHIAQSQNYDPRIEKGGGITMYGHAAYAMPPITWILVADTRQARTYSYHEITKDLPLSGTSKLHYFKNERSHELVEIPEMTLNAGEGYDHSHWPEQRFVFRENVLKVLSRNFVSTVVKRLEIAHNEKHFDRLIIAAPAKMIGDLRNRLKPDVQICVVAVLPKDLTEYQGEMLLTHLQDTLSEAHVA